ncbi:MAG: hypothetical protein AAFN11_02140 [Chloroflexota bacterium]
MNNRLARALIFGLVLALVGVGAFFLMYYVVLGNAEAATRLFASLIAPPVLMGFILLGLFILTRND